MSSSVPDPADPAEPTPEPQKDYLRGEHKVWFGGPRDDDIVVYPSTSGDYAQLAHHGAPGWRNEWAIED